jgi:hypothetical protein
MRWYFYALEFVAGALLANGVPHFVQGISGHPFPSPFASPPGVGDSSPRVNVVWGFVNFVAGAILLHSFWPEDGALLLGSIAAAAGALLLSWLMADHFGKVRAGKV